MDGVDKNLLRKLIKNAKLPLKDLADEVGVHQNTLMNRIKRLEKIGIIRNFTVNLNEEKLGYLNVAIIRLRADDRNYPIDELMARISAIPQTVCVYEVTGEYDADVFVKARSNEELLEIIRRIRSMEGVLETNSQHVLKTHKEHPDFNPFGIY